MIGTWGGIILAFLKLVNWLIREGEKHKWITEGQQIEIGKQLVEIARKHEVARQYLAEVRQLSDAELDNELSKLEPGQR